MEHYGDIMKLNGAELPPVDVITGGSPCQDLSVAGKREGLSGARSGLFMEQIRVIKEMRRATNGKKPRFMVWENVPGAFSSNKGEDFRCVLEETVKIAEPDAAVPGPPKGKWAPSGCVMGDGWSVAWRVHDAQFWGVPQRRRRIALVADFGGPCAHEILFEREGVLGNPAPRGEEGQEAPGDAGTGASEAGGVAVLNDQGGGMMHVTEDVTGTLRAQEHGHQPLVFEPGIASRCGGHVYEGVAGTVRANAGDNRQAVVYGIGAYNSEGMMSPNPHSGIYEADTARTLDVSGGSPACNQGGMAVVCAGFDGSMGAKAGNIGYEEELSPTLNAGKQMHTVCATTEMTPKVDEGGTAFFLRSRDYKDPQIVAFAQNQRDEVRCLGEAAGALAAEPGVHQQTYVLQGNMIGREDRNGPQGSGVNEDVSFTLNATDRHAVCVENHPQDSRVKIREDDTVQTLSGRMRTGGGNVPMVLERESYQDVTGSLCVAGYDKLGVQEAANDLYVVQRTYAMQAIGEYKESDVGSSCKARDCKDSTDLVAYDIDRAAYNQGENAKYDFSIEEEKIATQVARGPGAVYASYQDVTGTLCARISAGTSNQLASNQLASDDMFVANSYIVRRLTPLECTRLQGFPDGWVDIGDWVDSKGKAHKDADSPKYKALGNSIALPFWEWMAGRMAAFLPESATMGSLFDGISGFCLVFARVGCKPIFSSEIEEFPIAVAKKHFGDEGDYAKYL